MSVVGESHSLFADPSKYAKIDPEDSFQDDAEDHYEERDVFDKSEESASPASVLQNDQAVNKNTPENNEAISEYNKLRKRWLSSASVEKWMVRVPP